MVEHSVDTFEHDIVDEIRHREASISDIASAVGDIGNDASETTSKSTSVLISVVVILILCGLAGAGYFGYSYFMNSSPTQPNESTLSPEKKIPSGLQLSTVSPTLNRILGTFLTKTEKTKDGYIITINSYSPVFSYMIRNEHDFGNEIALAVGNTETIKNTANTTPVVPIISTSTTATTTKKVATSTKIIATSTPPMVEQNILSTDYTFSDVTISNQNMRVGTSVYGTVVYAFIGTQKLVIASSIEGILALRTSLLTK